MLSGGTWKATHYYYLCRSVLHLFYVSSSFCITPTSQRPHSLSNLEVGHDGMWECLLWLGKEIHSLIMGIKNSVFG